MGSGGKSGGSGTVNPYQAAQAAWLFNRPNEYGPTSSTINTFPGQTPPNAGRVGFVPGQLTPGAATAFGQPGTSATKGGQTPNTNPTTGGNPSGPVATALTNPSAQSDRMYAQDVSPIIGGGLTTGSGSGPPLLTGGLGQPGLAGSGNSTGGVFPNGVPTTPGSTTTILTPAQLALQSGQATAQANTLADALSRQQAMAGGSLPNLVSGLNTTGLPGLPSDPAQFDTNTINTMFNLGAQPLQREFGRDLDTLQQSLANKGLAFGGDAASKALDTFGRTQSDALQNLASQSVLAGGQEATRSINDILGIRGQGVQEQGANAQLASGSRSQQFNELQALLSGNQVGTPNQPGQAPIDVLGAFGLNAQGQQAQNAQNAATKGGATQAATSLATIMAMSDRRLKSHIRFLGKINGVNVYAYRIANREETGVMADEVPWAAHRIDGFDRVDYGRVF